MSVSLCYMSIAAPCEIYLKRKKKADNADCLMIITELCAMHLCIYVPINGKCSSAEASAVTT